MNKLTLVAILSLIITLSACANAQPTPDPTATAVIAKVVATNTTVSPTNTPSPSPSPLPTQTPQPAATTSLWNSLPTTEEISFGVVNQIGGRMTAVQIVGNLAYLGVGPRLVVLDISNSSHPQVIGQSDVFPGIVEDVALVQNVTYVSTGENGFWTVDVSNPTAPQTIQFEPHHTTVRQIEYQDNHLFVLGQKVGEVRGNDLAIYALSEDGTRVEINRAALPYQHYVEVLLDKDAIYVTEPYSEEVVILKLEDLERPFLANAILADGTDAKTASNQTLYTITNGTLTIFEVSDAGQTIEVATIENLIDDHWEIDRIMVRGNYLFVSAWYCDQRPCGATLFAFEITDSNQVKERGSLLTDGSLIDIHVSDDAVYPVTSSQFLVTTLPERSTWQTLGSLQDSAIYGAFRRLAVADDRLYAVNAFGYGVGIFSLENPAQPVRAGLYSGAFEEVAAGNQQIYPSAGWRDGLHQVNVNYQNLPSRSNSWGADDSVDGPPVLEGTHLYALLDGYLAILDVANSREMILLNEVDLNPPEYGPYRNISYAEGIVYAQGLSGISLLDVTDPGSVIEIGFIPKDEAMCALTARDDFVYVYSTSSFCDRDSETKHLTIYDASNPTAVEMVSRLEIDSHVETMLLKDAHLYLPGGDLTVIDISQPDSPQLLGKIPTPGEAHATAVLNDLIYVADGAGGILVLKLEE